MKCAAEAPTAGSRRHGPATVFAWAGGVPVRRRRGQPDGGRARSLIAWIYHLPVRDPDGVAAHLVPAAGDRRVGVPARRAQRGGCCSCVAAGTAAGAALRAVLRRALEPRPHHVRAGRPRHVVPHLRRLPEPQVLRPVREPTGGGSSSSPASTASSAWGNEPAVALHACLAPAGPTCWLASTSSGSPSCRPPWRSRWSGRATRPRRRVVRHRDLDRLVPGRGHLLRGAVPRPVYSRPAVRRPAPHPHHRAPGDDDVRPARGARQPVEHPDRADHRRLRVPARGHLVTICLMAELLRLPVLIRGAAWVFLALTMIATIYLGWHFSVDALGGVAVGTAGVRLAARATGNPLRRREDPGPSAPRSTSRPRRAGRPSALPAARRPSSSRERRAAGRRTPRPRRSAYFVRGQKKPRSPSPFVRGTTWRCRCGTDWLTVLFMATNEPCAPRPSFTAVASRWAAARNASRSLGRQVGQRHDVLARHEQDVALEDRPGVEEADEVVGLEDVVTGQPPRRRSRRRRNRARAGSCHTGVAH